MQSSLVHVPCKSGSPQGVFSGAQLLAAGAVFPDCAHTGPLANTSPAAVAASAAAH